MMWPYVSMFLKMVLESEMSEQLLKVLCIFSFLHFLEKIMKNLVLFIALFRILFGLFIHLLVLIWHCLFGDFVDPFAEIGRLWCKSSSAKTQRRISPLFISVLSGRHDWDWSVVLSQSLTATFWGSRSFVQDRVYEHGKLILSINVCMNARLWSAELWWWVSVHCPPVLLKLVCVRVCWQLCRPALGGVWAKARQYTELNSQS